MGYEGTFGLPENKNVETIQPNVLYGFTYYNSAIGEWLYYVGTFPYLWGIYSTLNLAEQKLMNQVPTKAYSFFYLDGQHLPIKLIGTANISGQVAASIGQPNTARLSNLSLALD